MENRREKLKKSETTNKEEQHRGEEMPLEEVESFNMDYQEELLKWEKEAKEKKEISKETSKEVKKKYAEEPDWHLVNEPFEDRSEEFNEYIRQREEREKKKGN
jgi:hypothetical protein